MCWHPVDQYTHKFIPTKVCEVLFLISHFGYRANTFDRSGRVWVLTGMSNMGTIDHSGTVVTRACHAPLNSHST